MTHTYLIDGYNLIHALGMIQKRADSGGLEAARRQLLDFLAQAFGAASSRVTIVFDAKQAPRNLPREQEYRGLHVQFAPKGQSADDCIETLIARHPAPATLVVVSNDQRLQDAARRRGSKSWSDQNLLDFLDRGYKTERPSVSHAEERGEQMTPAERAHWLEEFGMLQDDPELKEFFDLDRFD